jgi:two-component system, OmpR family, response regulator BaeR
MPGSGSADHPRIVIVEDEPKLVALLTDYFQAENYVVEPVTQGDAVLAVIAARPPALILLDLNLPGMDGIDVCRAIRESSDVPIIIMTARVDEADRLQGLDLGADDYICKPFSPRELLARARAILRRVRPARQPGSEQGLKLDPDAYLALLDGHALELTRVEFRLLQALAESPGRVLTRQQLLNRLHDDYRIVTDRSVDSHIKNIRKKMAAVRPDQELLHSVYGIGYKFKPLA